MLETLKNNKQLVVKFGSEKRKVYYFQPPLINCYDYP